MPLQRIRKSRYISALSTLWVGAVLSGCGLGSARKRADQAQVSRAIENLSSGSLIRQMNGVRASSWMVGGAEPSVSPSTQPSTEPVGANAGAPPADDSCPLVENPTEASSPAQKLAAIRALGACFRALANPARLAMGALSFFETYTPDGPPSLSLMKPDELEQVLRRDFQLPADIYGTNSRLVSRIRNRYTDSDLEELLSLVSRRYLAFTDLGNQIYLAMDHRPWLIRSLQSIDRWAAFQAMKDHRDDLTGLSQAIAFQAVVGSSMPTPRQVRNFPVILFQPFALMAFVPGEGRELQPLDPVVENPFKVLSPLLLALGGGPQSVSEVLKTYRDLREADNQPMPVHEPAAGDAVRVAFLDTGIDFKQFNELGLFAGDGTSGQISQADYGDLDLNPWAPNLGGLAHGSGTLGTLLTLISQQAPELLQSRKIDVAMWKTFSLRSLLAGRPYRDLSTTDPRNPTAFADAIIDRIDGAGVKPKIVSVSLGGETESPLQKAHKTDILLRAPWLWVMAAGNEGQDVAAGRASCFDDIAPDRRLDARILCVGALKRMEAGAAPRVAYYSNFGARVDLYAFETYDERCPNGTSCSTPAITAAAAILAAKYPMASPEQIKQILVNASRLQSLEVDAQDGSSSATREVKIFDPVTMMPDALAHAEQVFHPNPFPSPSASPSAAEDDRFTGLLLGLNRR